MVVCEFYRILEAGHDREEGDLVPGFGVGVVGQHRGVVAVEDVEDAEGQAVLQRVGAVFARNEVELVAEVQAHIERHLPVVRVGEVVEGDFAGGQVSDVLAGRDGLPVAALQREGGADALPLRAGAEDVASVIPRGEGVAVVDVGEGAVRLRPGVGQAPLQPDLWEIPFVQELGAV